MDDLKKKFVEARREEKEAYAKLKISARKFYRMIESRRWDSEISEDHERAKDRARVASNDLVLAQMRYNAESNI